MNTQSTHGIIIHHLVPIALHKSDSPMHLLHRPRKKLWDTSFFGEFPFLLQQLVPSPMPQVTLVLRASIQSYSFYIESNRFNKYVFICTTTGEKMQ